MEYLIPAIKYYGNKGDLEGNKAKTIFKATLKEDFDLTMLDQIKLGDNRIQNFHFGRYIVGYTVGNLVLRRSANGAVKRDFRAYI